MISEYLKKKQELCDHKDIIEGSMTRQGIERHTLRCSNCGMLEDYYPQYITDNFDD